MGTDKDRMDGNATTAETTDMPLLEADVLILDIGTDTDLDVEGGKGVSKKENMDTNNRQHLMIDDTTDNRQSKKALEPERRHHQLNRHSSSHHHRHHHHHHRNDDRSRSEYRDSKRDPPRVKRSDDPTPTRRSEPRDTATRHQTQQQEPMRRSQTQEPRHARERQRSSSERHHHYRQQSPKTNGDSRIDRLTNRMTAIGEMSSAIRKSPAMTPVDLQAKLDDYGKLTGLKSPKLNGSTQRGYLKDMDTLYRDQADKFFATPQTDSYPVIHCPEPTTTATTAGEEAPEPYVLTDTGPSDYIPTPIEILSAKNQKIVDLFNSSVSDNLDEAETPSEIRQPIETEIRGSQKESTESQPREEEPTENQPILEPTTDQQSPTEQQEEDQRPQLSPGSIVERDVAALNGFDQVPPSPPRTCDTPLQDEHYPHGVIEFLTDGQAIVIPDTIESDKFIKYMEDQGNKIAIIDDETSAEFLRSIHHAPSVRSVAIGRKDIKMSDCPDNKRRRRMRLSRTVKRGR